MRKIYGLILLLSSFSLFAEDADNKKEKLHTVYEGGGETKFRRITNNEKAIRNLQKQVLELKQELEKLKMSKEQ